jgi:hypothetical protein
MMDYGMRVVLSHQTGVRFPVALLTLIPRFPLILNDFSFFYIQDC